MLIAKSSVNFLVMTMGSMPENEQKHLFLGKKGKMLARFSRQPANNNIAERREAKETEFRPNNSVATSRNFHPKDFPPKGSEIWRGWCWSGRPTHPPPPLVATPLIAIGYQVPWANSTLCPNLYVWLDNIPVRKLPTATERLEVKMTVKAMKTMASSQVWFLSLS